MTKIKLKKPVVDFLNIGTKLYDGVYEYSFIPFWFKSTDKPNVFEILNFEHLPKELIELINNQRNQ